MRDSKGDAAMILRETKNGEMLVMGQTDHSRLVGQLAAHWGNAQFAVPRPYDTVARAAAFHDYGWLRYETAPLFDAASGGTPEFRKVPASPRQIEGYKWCGDWLLADDPYASLIVTMHRAGLWSGRYDAVQHPGHPRFPNLGQEIKDFVAQSEARQQQAQKEIDPQELWTNYRLLQVWDLLGLYFCCQDPYEDYIEPVPVRYGGGRMDGVRLALKPADSRTVAFDPFPFATRPCHVQLAYRRLPAGKFADEASFRRAYYGAELDVMNFELV
jgi:hypothetical protein